MAPDARKHHWQDRLVDLPGRILVLFVSAAAPAWPRLPLTTWFKYVFSKLAKRRFGLF
jgi:hypothetical protein